MRRKFIKATATLLSTAFLLAGDANPERAGRAWEPFIPLAAADVLDATTTRVHTITGEQCLVGIQHVLEGLSVTAVKGTVSSPACRAGDEILPGQLPEHYDSALDTRRHRWEQFLGLVTPIVHADKSGIQLSTNASWVTRIGHRGTQGVQLYDGREGTYGPDLCMVAPSNSNPETPPTYLRGLGSVAFSNKAYAVSEIIGTSFEDAGCRPGDVVLVETGPVSAT